MSSTSAVPPQPDASEGALRIAYQEACKGFDSIQTFRVKLLALLPLASGAGIFLLLRELPESAREHLAAVGAFGFFTTLGLFLYELHGMRECKHLLSCAAVLERSLKLPSSRYRAYSDNLKLVGPIGAAWVIYPAVMFAWTYVAYVRLGYLCLFIFPGLVVLIGLPLFWSQMPDWRKSLDEAWQPDADKKGSVPESVGRHD